jgi:DNA-binding PadR family transcriptional regulator
MSPVFRHGGLRLYLLKLLDESPRHGYEVIRLLQDRFLGVYAPSPGTIYPRLARLEEDGLVTHEEVDGKKVYRITDKGRAEINARLDDLADLEEELTQSVRDVAREISQDVRDTVRSIREDLTWAARNVRTDARDRAAEARAEARQAREGARSERDDARQQRDDTRRGRDETRQQRDDTRRGGSGDQADDRARHHDEGNRIREEARRAREDMRDKFRAQRRSGRDWRTADWTDPGAWAEWAGWPGRGDDEDDEQPGRTGRGRARHGHGPFADLEQMAIDFAGELRSAASRTGDIGEGALGDLRDILSETLAKIRDEVLRPGADEPAGAEPDEQDEDNG